jgi:hypothetical protein
VQLFRVFDWDGRSLGDRSGGPLFVNRERQGAGRHDIPDLCGAWYLSQSPVSAVAETLQYLRGHTIAGDDFTRANRMRKALAAIDLADAVLPIDLDDPGELSQRRWRPSQVATLHRPTTQTIARTIFDSGAVGLCWWSVLEASWINVTLFQERALPHVTLAGRPRLLSVSLDEVREAAAHLGIQLE